LTTKKTARKKLETTICFEYKSSQPQVKLNSTYCKDKSATFNGNKYTHTLEDLQLIILFTMTHTHTQAPLA